MKNIIEYKGYTARVDFDADDEIFVGRVLGIKDRLNFHCNLANEVKQAFQCVVDDYLELCERKGKEPQKPFSGEFRYRPGPERHAALARLAAIEGASVNDLVNMAVTNLLEKKSRDVA